MKIKLLIGLGNPGTEHKNTYHNVGKLFIDELAGEGVRFKKEKYFEYVKSRQLPPKADPPQAENANSQELVLAKTLTFMNQSGGGVAAAKKYFNSKPVEILIIHDDSDIPLGSFKLSFGRGGAGHHGVESIIKSLRTKRFYRLRIGIRPKNQKKRIKAGQLVLKKISNGDKELLKRVFRKIRVLLARNE
ncbi:MAG: aminoacyl-tRNA hydrolase [Candidatus Colwellbacteria bacterium]|nr:aminoacyl-tRNA hydrolase [Candidatus Colwellbacteria bacterium]